MRERRVYQLFCQALDADDESDVLDSCGELRGEVEALLRAHRARTDDFLAVPAGERLQIRTLGPGARIGGYTIRGVIASGGAATVYEAEQDRPRRAVALKVIPIDADRFAAEAEILARLDHPDVATVYEAGPHEGGLFIAMELVEGQRLDEWAAGRPRRETLALFARVCRAVHHGHVRGVAHRDLKPSNILVRDTGPKVIDFGIAAVEGAAGAGIAGTLPYMSPEQCEPDARIDARSDIYALGVVLYELARGRRPYDVPTSSLEAARRVIREQTPPDLTGDVGAILARALAKAPDERYASAAALADDVERFLRFEPVAARAASWLHVVRLFARRRTTLFVTMAALGVALVAGTMISLRFAARAQEASEAERRRAYAAHITAAEAALRVFDIAGAGASLAAAPRELRGWEWDLLQRRLDRSTLSVPGTMVQARAGHLHAVVTEDGQPTLVSYDAASGRRLDAARMPNLTWWSAAPGGDAFAFGTYDGRIHVRATAGGEDLHVLAAHTNQVKGLAFGSGGERLGTYGWDRRATLWRWRDAALLGECELPPGERYAAVAFDPTGATVALARRAGIEFRADDDFRLLRLLPAHDGKTTACAFADDGTLATAGADHEICIWDRSREAVVKTLRQRDETATRLVFLPGGVRLAAGFPDGTVTVWDVASGRVVETFWGHERHVSRLEALDTNVFVSSSGDGTSRVWRIDRPAANASRDAIRSLAYLPDGGTIVAGCWGSTLLVADGATGDVRRRVRVLDEPRVCLEAVAVAPDGGRVVCGGWHGHAFVIETAGWTVEHAREMEAPVLCAAFAPGGDEVVLGLHTGAVVCDPATLERRRFVDAGDWVVGIAYVAGELITVTQSGRLARWRQGRARWERETGREGASGLALHPGGREFVVTYWSGAAESRDGATGALKRTYAAQCIWSASFNRDGTRLALSDHRAVHLLDAQSWEHLLDLRGHENAVFAVTFSPDGRRLASAGAAGRLVVR